VSWLPRTRWGEVPPRVQAVFERFHTARGNVPNLFRVFALRPELMAGFHAHFDAAMAEEGTLGIRLKELVAVRVSTLNRSEY
jgi:alkylhydroperoxidase family enzyme